MDQMTPFERQIGDELRREVGPAPEFDPLAISRSVAAGSGRLPMITRHLTGGVRLVPSERGFSMFSAVKLVVAAAVIALVGGLAIVGLGPNDQGGDVAPAASTSSGWPDASIQALAESAADQVAVVHFTLDEPSSGVFTYQPGLTKYGDGVSYQAAEGVEFTIVDPDDPRVSGTMRRVTNRMTFLDAFEELSTTATRIDNEAGSWIGTGQQFGFQRGIAAQDLSAYQALLRGTGAYEGLSLYIDQPSWQDSVTGIIFPGEMPLAPDVPEPAPVE